MAASNQSVKHLLERLSAENARILSYIEDDKATGRKGLYGMNEEALAEIHELKQEMEKHRNRMTDLELKQGTLENQNKQVMWKIGGVTFSGGTIIGLIIKWVLG